MCLYSLCSFCVVVVCFLTSLKAIHLSWRFALTNETSDKAFSGLTYRIKATSWIRRSSGQRMLPLAWWSPNACACIRHKGGSLCRYGPACMTQSYTRWTTMHIRHKGGRLYIYTRTCRYIRTCMHVYMHKCGQLCMYANICPDVLTSLHSLIHTYKYHRWMHTYIQWRPTLLRMLSHRRGHKSNDFHGFEIWNIYT